MIQVITTVELQPGCQDKFLSVLKECVPRVKAEAGCLIYEPMVDVDSGMPTQGKLRANTVTVVEAWADLEALQHHLKVPHMVTFREAAKAYVQGVSHQVFQPV